MKSSQRGPKIKEVKAKFKSEFNIKSSQIGLKMKVGKEKFQSELKMKSSPRGPKIKKPKPNLSQNSTRKVAKIAASSQIW